MEQYFYVLFNNEYKLFYSGPSLLFGFTDRISQAKQYYSVEETKRDLNFSKVPKNWTVKKITLSIEL